MLKALIDELKTYGFECPAGPLEKAVPFQQLEEAVIEVDKLSERVKVPKKSIVIQVHACLEAGEHESASELAKLIVNDLIAKGILSDVQK